MLLRQSPGTANNTTFMTIEDEIGHINIIVWNNVAQKYPRPFLQSQLLEVEDKLQHHSGVMHLIADEIIDHSRWLGVLRVNARHFR